MPTAIALIPARMASTRFPGKMLADQTGKPLIQHVCDAVRRAQTISRIIVATDDQRVADAVSSFGGESVLTSPDHTNGTSRLAEAAQKLGLGPEDLVANVQGDEPEIEPKAIDAAVALAARAGIDVATAASPFVEGEDPRNPNIVKVVRRADGTALYFSRALVPHHRDGGIPATPLKHVGLYVYRVGFLRRYAALAPTPLEQSEVLEQLRILEHGHTIGVAVVPCRTQGIDTPEQYAAFVERWKKGRI